MDDAEETKEVPSEEATDAPAAEADAAKPAAKPSKAAAAGGGRTTKMAKMKLQLAVGSPAAKRESKMLHKTFRTGAGPGAKPEGEEAVPEKKVQHKRHAGNTSFPTDARGVLNPNSDFRRQWDMTGFLMLIFVALVTPFEIAFVGGDRLDALKLVNWVVNLYFLFDLFLNFNTGYFNYKDGLWVTRRDSIAAQYMKSWCARPPPPPRTANRARALGIALGFSESLSDSRTSHARARANFPFSLVRRFWIDLISVVPYDEILWLMTYNERQAADDDALDDGTAGDNGELAAGSGGGGGSDDSGASELAGLLKLVRLARLLKLMRVLRANRIMQRWATRISLSFGMQARRVSGRTQGRDEAQTPLRLSRSLRIADVHQVPCRDHHPRALVRRRRRRRPPRCPSLARLDRG